MTDRGEITLGVLVLVGLLSWLGGYVSAQIDQRREMCQAVGKAGLCLFGEGSPDVATPVPVVQGTDREAPSRGTVAVSVRMD